MVVDKISLKVGVSQRRKPKVLLLVLDGWGVRTSSVSNAISAAKTPVLDSLYRSFAHTTLGASGAFVGLPSGFIGNSEVGHLTIGAGRVVETDLVRINSEIQSGAFFRNKALLHGLLHARTRDGKIHLMGLLSDAGVHSHYDHLIALLKLCKRFGFSEVYVHAFLDGRDTPPKSGIGYVTRLLSDMKKLGVGQLASMMGRYYAMDRDNRWNREHQAYDAMVNCRGRYRADAVSALKEFYVAGETDEFVKPTLLLNRCVVEQHDTVFFFNFRSDRARELTRAFVSGRFGAFTRKKIGDLCFVTLTQYEKDLGVLVAYPPVVPRGSLGEVVGRAGLRQLRVAETEKWSHVTYFMNGLCECRFAKEDRFHIASRKVKTYDIVPQMKAREIVDCVLASQKKYDLIIANIANADMVGHTGNFKASVLACSEVDTQIGRLILGFDGLICITSDHGNCEDMSPAVVTSHTTSRVPFIVVDTRSKNGVQNMKLVLRTDGGLADVAPTVLSFLGLKKPKVMGGKSLILG